MARQGPSNDTAFNSLPIELNQIVAKYIDKDHDIATYSLICRKTQEAINADGDSFWHYKHRSTFALPPGVTVTNQQLKAFYQHMTKHLRLGLGYDFFRGHRTLEKDVVRVLRVLINESFLGPAQADQDGRPTCNNIQQLANFIRHSRLLLADRRTPPPAPGEPVHVSSMLAAVKTVLFQFLFELNGVPTKVYGVDESQHAVYLATQAAPLYVGPSRTTVNMAWMLHCMQFFRNHMLNEDVGTLYPSMQELGRGDKPTVWDGPLQKGSYALSKYWKGTFAFLDHPELAQIRRLSPNQLGSHYFQDLNVDDGKIQSLEFDFSPETQLNWPDSFESRLSSRRAMPIPTQQMDPTVKDIQFTGTGSDADEDFYLIGWINALPLQYGIQGWQRITFMKHFMVDPSLPNTDNLWAYEGVVLPGGRMILGRWWYASEDPVDFSRDTNGPFILWAVDPPTIEDEDEDENEDDK